MFIHITYKKAMSLYSDGPEEIEEVIQISKITRTKESPDYLIFGTRPHIESRCLLDIESFWIEDD